MQAGLTETTNVEKSNDTPVWLDRSEYPWEPHYFQTKVGRIHWIEAGQGEPIVFVHGTPTWSFEWRHLLKHFSATHRVLALDYLGFGLSDKPTDWTFRPEDHAANLAAWIDHLGLKRFTLVVNDFGGPIGLSYAVAHPEKIQAIVLMNTWMWPLDKEPRIRLFGKLFGGALGRWLYLKQGLSVNAILPSAYGDPKKLTNTIHQHYKNALPSPEARLGTYGMLKGLIGSSDWYASLWNQREKLQGIPMQILWGMKDTAFLPADLDRWLTAFPKASVARVTMAGHLPQEEEPELVTAQMEAFFKTR